MEYDTNMPRTPAPFSRGVTPSGRTGRGNNRFGNKGTKKCIRCRELKRACKFNDPKDICELCASKKAECSDKIMSVDQAKIKEEAAEGDVKRLAAQGHLQWNEEDSFLDNVLYITRNHMDPRAVVLKLHAEIVFYLQAQDQALPAPQVVPQDPTGMSPFGSVQMQQPQEMDPYAQPVMANFFAPAPPNYATQLQPVPEIFVTQFQGHSPNGTPQPYNEGRQGIPKLPTPQPQSLEPPNPPDYRDQTSMYDWNMFTSQDYQMDVDYNQLQS
jgi:hypothetical protein